MISGPPTEYEQLSPEEAAHIDAICDDFEQAWKSAGGDPLKRAAAGEPPLIATYLDGWVEPGRTILARELIALDRACRERYGLPTRPQDYEDLVAKVGTSKDTRDQQTVPSSPAN